MNIKGNRTYVCAFVLAIAGAAYGMDLIDAHMFQSIVTVFGAGAAAALRAAVSETGNAECACKS